MMVVEAFSHRILVEMLPEIKGVSKRVCNLKTSS
jgi:hypothetical protein